MGIKTCLQTVESTAEEDRAGAHSRQGEVEGLALTQSCEEGAAEKKPDRFRVEAQDVMVTRKNMGNAVRLVLQEKNMHHLNPWHILPQTGCKILEIFSTQVENHKHFDLALKAAWHSCPLWPKLLWLLNQLPLDEALSHSHVPSRHADPTLVANWSVQAVGCRLHRLPAGARCCEPQSQTYLPLKILARGVAPGVFNKWHRSSGFELRLCDGKPGFKNGVKLLSGWTGFQRPVVAESLLSA